MFKVNELTYASKEEIALAVEHGRKVIIEAEGCRIESYIYNGHRYFVSITILPE